MALRPVAARIIHQHSAHASGNGAKQMLSILPTKRLAYE
jgi:hypothetical protein